MHESFNAMLTANCRWEEKNGDMVGPMVCKKIHLGTK